MSQRLEFFVYDEDESQERLWTRDQPFGRSRVIIPRKAIPCRVEHGWIQLQRNINVVLLATLAEFFWTLPTLVKNDGKTNAPGEARSRRATNSIRA
jgi:hypothetical protein